MELETIAATTTTETEPRRRHRHRHRRRRPSLRPRMRFAWWQLWVAAAAVAMICALLAVMQPWHTPPPPAMFIY